MEELLDLGVLKASLSELIAHSNMDDCVLPDEFKAKFRSFGEYKIEQYNLYTLQVSSRKSLLVIPNQWVYIAACCCQYYIELMKYKNKLEALGFTNDMYEACHPSKDNGDISEDQKTKEICKEKAEHYLENYDGADKEFLVNFLWNYEYWGGGKNIKRSNDFTDSPVLNIANTINASSSLIGAIVKGLANQDCLNLLLESEEWKSFEGTSASSYTAKKNSGGKMALQQIFYGAPGTGKSYEVNSITKKNRYATIRTTFHPDSDYSTFVGAYKPTMADAPVYGAQGVEIAKEKRITYTFVKQAFLKAYLGAWQKLANGVDSVEPQFLVIEEINRGNCAQIFGDLFQLLDRSGNGFSTYPIEADADLQNEIAKEFGQGGEYMLANEFNVDYAVPDYISNYGKTLTEDIKLGRILLLPNNLYIWATMNTSDQSLFPIDSAFKRRWEWRYVKISNGYKRGANGEFIIKNSERVPLGWKIRFNNNECDWWEFLEAINKQIGSVTSSDDKKLGYFFCKPNLGESFIREDKFVNKVIFYLWNDVFKDCDVSIFRMNDTDDSFYDIFFIEDEQGNTIANPDAIGQLMNNLGVRISPVPYDNDLDEESGDDSDENQDDTQDMSKVKFKYNGVPNSLREIVKSVVLNFISSNPDLTTAASIRDKFKEACADFTTTVVKTENEYNELDVESSKAKCWQAISLNSGEKLYIYTQWKAKNANDNFFKLMKVVENNNWGQISPVE